MHCEYDTDGNGTGISDVAMVHDGWLPAKPAFLVCDGSTDNRQQQQQIGAQNVNFQKSPHFSKFSENATPLIKIDESSKLLR